MAFTDPSDKLFSPSSSTAEESRGTNAMRMQPIPEVANINSPLSRSIKNPGSVNYKADDTWGTIFKGIAKVGDQAIEAADTVVKLDIDDTIRTGVRAIQDQHAIAANELKTNILAEGPSNSASDAPPGLFSNFNKMNTLAKAKRVGAISDSRYTSELQELVSGVKMRYPGYVKEIDEKIKSITGQDPGNTMRELNQKEIDLYRQMQTANADKQSQYLRTNEEYLPPNWKNMSMDEIQSVVENKKRTMQDFKADEALYNFRQRHGIDQTTNIEGTFNAKGSAVISDAITQITQHPAVQKLMANPQDMKPEEIQAATQVINMVKLQATQSIHQFGNTPLDYDPKTGYSENPQNTYRFLLSKGKDASRYNNIVEQIFRPINELQDALTKGEGANVQTYANMIKLMEQKGGYDALKNSNSISKWKYLNGALGSEFLRSIVTTEEGVGLFRDVLEAKNDALRVDNLEGSVGRGEPFSVQAQNAQKNGTFKAKDWRNMLGDKLKTITSNDPKVTPAAKANTLKSIIDDPDPLYFIRELGVDQKLDNYSKVVSPEMIKTAKSMGAEAFAKYSMWAKTNFQHAFKSTGDSIRDDIQSSRHWDIRYNPEKAQFDYTLTEQGRREGLKNPNSMFYGLDRSTILKLEILNKGLKDMQEVYKAGGVDGKEELARLVQTLGLEEGDLKKQGFWYQIHSKSDKMINQMIDNLKKPYQKKEQE